ncbi:MAG TPA: Xaa-Pro peptidase family protein [Candidatus Bathyarchaeia archaeon]|nr:Xaa-Pro peptidase family protein [Candidatus Bathyarchaeia archaeon]
MPSGGFAISLSEYRDRVGNVRSQLKRKKLGALYLTNPTRILYTTGFSHISTERPLAVVIPREGPIFLMGPSLESDHVKLESRIIEEVFTYPDYPGKLHPIRRFARILADKGFAKSRIAIDSPSGAAGGYGYAGPSITNVMSRAEFIDGRDILDRLRLVKSRQEIQLLRESAKWSQVAHDILIENTRAGVHDAVTAVKASYEALAKMLNRLGSKYVQLKWGLSPVVVGFRGQVGANSAIPHSVYTAKKIRRGDVLVTEAGVEMGGYTSELERTMIVGKPSSKARKYFEAMLAAREAALGRFRAGAACSSVDAAAREKVDKLGFSETWRHHTGHGIGLEGHEPPWLDPGDKTVMRVGMVFSCEPGLYVPGYAGFRHSDTVEVTGSGMKFITSYPSSLKELTV